MGRVTSMGSKPGWKRCSHCRQEKPATHDHFRPDKSKYLGCAAWCRICQDAFINRPAIFRLAGAIKHWSKHEAHPL